VSPVTTPAKPVQMLSASVRSLLSVDQFNPTKEYWISPLLLRPLSVAKADNSAVFVGTCFSLLTREKVYSIAHKREIVIEID